MTDIHFDLGERLRTVRKKHGLSQREIAKRENLKRMKGNAEKALTRKRVFPRISDNPISGSVEDVLSDAVHVGQKVGPARR